jgi:putative membrane protein
MNFFDLYPYLKIFHLISIITFMAGILYLPRLFVYHSMQEIDSPQAKMLEIMEYKLLKYIVNPAIITTLISGVFLTKIFLEDKSSSHYWLYIKLSCFLGLCIFHILCCIYRKKFLLNTKFHTTKYFRIFNEIPTILMIVIVFVVVLK